MKNKNFQLTEITENTEKRYECLVLCGEKMKNCPKAQAFKTWKIYSSFVALRKF